MAVSGGYLADVAHRKVRGGSTRSFAVYASTLLLLVAMLFGALGSLAVRHSDSRVSEVSAFEIFCGEEVGSMMSTTRWGGAFQGIPADNSSGRTLTLNQAYSNTPKFVTYFGEGEGADFTRPAPDRPKRVDDIAPVFAQSGQNEEDGEKKESSNDKSNKSDKDAPSRVQDTRNPHTCFTGSVLNGISNGTTMMIMGIYSVGSFIVDSVFNPTFFCAPGQKGACINLHGILSGNDGKGGLIGSLTNSVLLPLSALATLVIGVWMLWVSLARRAFREAFVTFGKITAFFILGLALLANPGAIASAPQVAVNTISGCVVGAMSGQNCLDGTRSSAKIEIDDKGMATNSTSDNVCAGAGGSALDAPGVLTGNMQCLIWKSFVLQPWSQAQFGASFDDMDVSNKNVVNALEKAGFKGSDFCVNLSPAGKPSSFYGRDIEFKKGGTQVCNIAAYQIATGVAAKNSTADQVGGDPDVRWFKLAWLMANSGEGAWKSWSGSATAGFVHLATMGLSAFSSVVGIVALSLLGLFALAYYVLVSIMIVMGPIMLLAALIPGVGMRIFLGWLENIVGGILKYMVTSILLLVALVFFGGILGNVSNPLLALAFVIIVSLAMLMYRRELANLMGAVNMGGQQLASGQALKNMTAGFGRSARNATVGAVGGAVGASMQSNKEMYRKLRNDPEKRRGRVGAFASAAVRSPFTSTAGIARGAASGMTDRMKRSGGVVGQAMRTYDNMERDNARAAGETRAHIQSRRDELSAEGRERQESLAQARGNVQNIQDRVNKAEDEVADQKFVVQVALQAHDNASEFVNTNAASFGASPEIAQDFKEWSNLVAQLQDVQLQKAVVPAGSTEAFKLEEQKQELRAGIGRIEYRNEGDRVWERLQDKYEGQVETHYANNGVAYRDSGVSATQNISNEINAYATKVRDLQKVQGRHDDARRDVAEAQVAVDVNKEMQGVARKAHESTQDAAGSYRVSSEAFQKVDRAAQEADRNMEVDAKSARESVQPSFKSEDHDMSRSGQRERASRDSTADTVADIAGAVITGGVPVESAPVEAPTPQADAPASKGRGASTPVPSADNSPAPKGQRSPRGGAKLDIPEKDLAPKGGESKPDFSDIAEAFSKSRNKRKK